MSNDLEMLFDNLPELLTTEDAARAVHLKVSTIYDMKYRQGYYRIPTGMFIKAGRKVLIRRSKLKEWFLSRIA